MSADTVTVFEVGERVGWCLVCGREHYSDPESCPHCGAVFKTGASTVVTKVDRERGTITVSSAERSKGNE